LASLAQPIYSISKNSIGLHGRRQRHNPCAAASPLVALPPVVVPVDLPFYSPVLILRLCCSPDNLSPFDLL
jgi:hypothetical protein